MSISTAFFVKSICGASGTMVEVEDLELNPEGVICCDNCKSILQARQSWYKLYGNPYK